MADASIPVDLLNPGQVFACLGFLEAADALLGDAEGGFDWSDETHVRFVLRAAGGENPFAVVLKFLAEVEVRRFAPIGYTDLLPKKKTPADDDEEQVTAAPEDLRLSETFPDRDHEVLKLRTKLPIRLESCDFPPIDLGHWADGSRRRNDFKLYSGNRSAHGIALAMLRGTRKKPSTRQTLGDVTTQGIDKLRAQQCDDLTAKPFHVLTLMGGSFNFDPRGAWTALDAGYSPNQHKHGLAASPVVEFLAAWGLENARPDEYETRKVRYGSWGGPIPLILARPALGGVDVAVPVRRFRFVLDLSGKNKVVSFAEEERNA